MRQSKIEEYLERESPHLVLLDEAFEDVVGHQTTLETERIQVDSSNKQPGKK